MNIEMDLFSLALASLSEAADMMLDVWLLVQIHWLWISAQQCLEISYQISYLMETGGLGGFHIPYSIFQEFGCPAFFVDGLGLRI